MIQLFNEYRKATKLARISPIYHSPFKKIKKPHIVILDGPLDSKRINLCKEYKAISHKGVIYDDHESLHNQNGIIEHCCGVFDRIREYSKFSDISVIRIFDEKLKTTPKTLFEGIAASVKMRADIINISVGVRDFSETVITNLRTACNYAEENGCLLVVAFEKNQKYLPALFNNVIRVRGEDLGTPGSFIVKKKPSFMVIAHGGLMTIKVNNKTKFVGGGSSFANGEITGVVANLIAKHGNISLAECKDLLSKHANYRF